MPPVRKLLKHTRPSSLLLRLFRRDTGTEGREMQFLSPLYTSLRERQLAKKKKKLLKPEIGPTFPAFVLRCCLLASFCLRRFLETFNAEMSLNDFPHERMGTPKSS